MVDHLAIYPLNFCAKACPFCRQPAGLTGEKDMAFFKTLLAHSRQVPAWTIGLGLQPVQSQSALGLFHLAWKWDHPYHLVTPYESLLQLDPQILSRSESIVVVVDDCKLAEHEWPMFFQTLAWAGRQHWLLEIEVTLTPGMLEKLLHSLLLDRLLKHSARVRLVVPKSGDFPLLGREAFGPLLDFVVENFRRNWLSSNRIVMEPCLLPVLSPIKQSPAPNCPQEGSLTVLGDGRVYVCPYGAALGQLKDPAEIAEYLVRAPGELEIQAYRGCSWRESWKVEETAATYAVTEECLQTVSSGREKTCR